MNPDLVATPFGPRARTEQEQRQAEAWEAHLLARHWQALDHKLWHAVLAKERAERRIGQIKAEIRTLMAESDRAAERLADRRPF
jgi:hypothetical protein